MDKKNKIYIGIAVVAFAITGYVLYTSFFGNHSAPPPTSDPAAAAAIAATQGALPQTETTAVFRILPLGNKFDTSILNVLNKQFNVFNYPQVASTDVGVDPANLIKSLDDTQSNK